MTEHVPFSLVPVSESYIQPDEMRLGMSTANHSPMLILKVESQPL